VGRAHNKLSDAEKEGYVRGSQFGGIAKIRHANAIESIPGGVGNTTEERSSHHWGVEEGVGVRLNARKRSGESEPLRRKKNDFWVTAYLKGT